MSWTWAREVITTATEIYEPNDTIGLIGLLIIGLPAFIPAIAGLIIVLRGQRKDKERWVGHRKVLDDIHKQAVNGHPESENMRDQLDRMEARQKRHDSLLDELSKDVAGLRRDDGAIHGQLRDHAEAHRSLETRVVQAFRREHPDSDPL